jgi:hypothetical protein
VPLDPYDKDAEGFAYPDGKLVNDQPVAVPASPVRQVSQAFADAASSHYTGSPKLRDHIPITDPYAAREQ